MRLGVIGNTSNKTSTTGIYSLEDKLDYEKRIGNLEFYYFTGKSRTVGTQDLTPGDLFLSADGTKCYVIGTTGNVIYQYTLTTPGDMNTATYASKSFACNSVDANVQGIYITPDGINLYMMGSSLDRVFHYIMTTPWDISTAIQPNVFNAVTQVSAATATGVRYGDNGTKMYILSSSTQEVVYQYTLSTPYDITTASYASKSLTITTQDATMSDIAFSSDGTKMYGLGDTNNIIYQYTLSTAWDISTGTYASKSLAVGTQDTVPRGFVFGDNGTKGYIVGTLNNRIYQYTFSTAWDISTGTYSTKNFIISGQTAAAQGICFNSSGTRMYLIDDAGSQLNAIYQYNLSTAWDVSTATYSSKTITTWATTSFYEQSPTGIDISNDGKTIIFVGANSGAASQSKVFSYPLSVADDLASANSYFSPLVTSQDSAMGSMWFKPDGTKLYLLGANITATMGVYQYTLSSPWNISTATYDSIKLDTTAQDTASSSIVFNKNGTRLLLSGSAGDKIYQYNLSTPWDISTATYVRNVDVYTVTGAGEAVTKGITLNYENNKLYFVGESLDTINQFDMIF